MKAPENDEFVAYVPDAIYFGDRIDVGDPVVASWREEDVHVLVNDAQHAVAAADRSLDMAS